MNTSLMQIGDEPWSRQEIKADLKEFLNVFESRPIKDNQGGMKAPHMFATWFMLRTLSPSLIVESGVWKGQSTWLIEQACPNAKIISIDINLDARVYISRKATYSNIDFNEQDWSDIPDDTLVFFDDHQSAYDRIIQSSWYGFKHVIFEDNYPPGHGDCYSLKQVFANSGFQPATPYAKGIKRTIDSRWRRQFLKVAGVNPKTLKSIPEKNSVAKNKNHANLLRKKLDVYYEFPPVFKSSETRWGTSWDDASHPTPEPIITDTKNDDKVDVDEYTQFKQDASAYTWICYAKLK